jgi:phosphoribosylaminoimidazole carboxylase (NCAIR synthetase)
MARKKKETAVPAPMDMSTRQHAHFEGHSDAPKFHLGQRVTAKVHGVVKEMSHGYDGKGHRLSIDPTSIKYSGHRAEKPSLKSQMKKVRVVASTPTRKKRG